MKPLLQYIPVSVKDIEVTVYTKTDAGTTTAERLPGVRARPFPAFEIFEDDTSSGSATRSGSDDAVVSTMQAGQGTVTQNEPGFVAGGFVKKPVRRLWYVLRQTRSLAQEAVHTLLEAYGLPSPTTNGDNTDQIMVDLAVRFVDWDSKPGMITTPNTCKSLRQTITPVTRH